MMRFGIVVLAAVGLLISTGANGGMPGGGMMGGPSGQGAQGQAQGGMMGHGMMGGQGGMMGGPGGMMGGMGGDHDRGRGPRGDHDLSHEGALISIMLAQQGELGLSAEQQGKLRELRTEATKDWIRRTAEIRIAELELDSLLERDAWDAAAIEGKVKQIATLTGERRASRLKALAAGRAVLTPDQLKRFREIGHAMRGPGGRPGGPRMGPDGGMGPGMTRPGGPGGGTAAPPAGPQRH